jgi:hypothetical protein
MTDVPTLVYALALGALEQQEREVSELRARTNTVIAAAALSASFLGAAAIQAHSGLSGWSIAALAMLVLTGGLSLIVLWPRELSFAFDARQTYARLFAHQDSAAQAQLDIAYAAGDRYRSNKRTIDRLETAFQTAVLALGLQTLLWTLAAGGTLTPMADKPTAPAPLPPPDKVKGLPQSVFIPEKRGGKWSTKDRGKRSSKERDE